MAQAQLTHAGAQKIAKVWFPRAHPVADTVKLNSGFEMPVIGFGTWQIPKAVAAEKVRDALDSGYRHVDCAASFKNQLEIAEGISQWYDDRKVERSELFISSKIWNTFHSRSKCLQEVDRILDIFGTPYMDLILIHWPLGWDENGEGDGEKKMWPRGSDGKMKHSNVDYMETWRALEWAQKVGKIRSIGFCNFSLEQADRIWREAEIKPSVIQVELNPFCSQLEYRKFCDKRGIVLSAHSPIGNPGSCFFRKHEDPNLLFNETIQSIARGHGKSAVQVILRWIIDSGLTAIIKSCEPKRIRQNINIFKFRLTHEEMARIDYLNQNFRIIDPIVGNYDNPHYPWPVKARK